MDNPEKELHLEHQDEGVALISVIAIGVVICLFLVLSIALVITTAPRARADQDAKTALAAAQAGLDEFTSRVTLFGDDVAKVLNDPANPAFDTIPATDACDGPGAPLQGTNRSNARFCYRIASDPRDAAAKGILTLDVTGFAGPDADRTVARTLRARIRMGKGANDFAYLSNYEIYDPSIPTKYAVGNGGQHALLTGVQQGDNPGVITPLPADLAGCVGSGNVGYRWNRPINRSDPSSSPGMRNCHILEHPWVGGDEIKGKAHTNDTFYTQKSVTPFRETELKVALPVGSDENAVHHNLTGRSQYDGINAKSIQRAEKVPFPDTLSDLYLKVKPVNGQPNAAEGCLYQGLTKITFQGDKVSVLSPSTTSFSPTCPNPNGTASKTPKLIFVEAAVGDCSTDPKNFPDAPFVLPKMPAESKTIQSVDYGKCRATALVKGSVSNADVTVAARADLVLIGNLVVPNLGQADNTDQVGLMAGNSVWLRHPVSCSKTNVCTQTLKVSAGQQGYSIDPITKIDASILAIKGSFRQENWQFGDNWGTGTVCEPLLVRGTIAQNFVGPMGIRDKATCITGYNLKVHYDGRLREGRPPYFIVSGRPEWHPLQITDRKAAIPPKPASVTPFRKLILDPARRFLN